jgi:hypothetical protein
LEDAFRIHFLGENEADLRVVTDFYSR